MKQRACAHALLTSGESFRPGPAGFANDLFQTKGKAGLSVTCVINAMLWMDR